MDKISGIIPSSSRVTNVDVKDSDKNNTRVTMPNRIDPSEIKSEMMAPEPSWKTKDAKHVAIVNEVANSFFMKKPEPQVEAREEMEEAPQMQQHLPQPEGLFPKGSFIDRSA